MTLMEPHRSPPDRSARSSRYSVSAIALQTLAITAAFFAYLGVRSVANASESAAFGHARRLLEFESRLGIDIEQRDAKDDMLSGFTKGGDDYITKPFSLEEVLARINAVLRRTGAAATGTTIHAYADLTMDEDAHRATRAGVAIDLSPTEWKLLRYLLMNAERVLSKTQILDHVWQYDFGGDASSVETYISYLRKKVDHVEPKLIQTVRGVGYTIRTGN